MPTPNITPIAGLDNSGLMNSSARVREVDPKLYYLRPREYPLVSTLFTMGTEIFKDQTKGYEMKGKQIKLIPTVDPKFEHTESDMLKTEFSPTAAVATGDASITVSTSDDDYFVAGMEIMLTNANDQREIARITAVGAGSLTVTRNIGSTGAIAMTTSDKFYLMGVVRAEDSTSTEARQSKSETLYNYIQFLSETYGNTLIQQATKNYHGNDYDRKKMEALARMKEHLEDMFWFGVRSNTNSTTNPIYHNGGVLWSLESLFTDVPVHDMGGAMNKPAFEAWLADLFKNGSQEKYVFASSRFLQAINSFTYDKLRITDVNTKKSGMVINEYQSTHGIVKLVHEPLFDKRVNMAGTAVGLDLDNVSVRYLEGNGVNLNLKSYDDIQENDRSGRKGEWIFVGGIDVKVGKSHAIAKNA